MVHWPFSRQAEVPMSGASARRRGTRTLASRLLADCRGVSAVEFAILAPVFLSMVVGVIEFGRVAYTQGVVSFAAEEATRYAVVNYSIDEEDVRNLARACLLGIDPDRINAIIVTGPIDPVDNTRTISVEVSYSFEFLPPLGVAPTATGTAIGCGRG